MCSSGAKNVWTPHEPSVNSLSGFKRFSAILFLEVHCLYKCGRLLRRGEDIPRDMMFCALADSTMKFDIIGKYVDGEVVEGDDRK